MADTLLRKELKEAILEQGLQDTNFFNGRLLTAADLIGLQKASRRRDQLLAQAIGAGVVCGLEVSLAADTIDGKPPVLAVTKGLAVNRSGQIISLPVNVEVALAKERPERIPPAGFFDVCEPIQQNGKPLPGKGAYLFVARPALDYLGSAPRRGFGQDAKVEDCDRDMLVEGVQFRLVMMDINRLENLSLATRQALTVLLGQVETPGPAGLAAQNKLRNWLAHACFGTEELAGFIEDPLSSPGGISPFESYGAVDKLREEGLIDDCDVPLALVCWTATGVKWVDMWSARRLTRAYPDDPLGFVQEHLIAEGEAAFLQFQEQLQEWMKPSVPRVFLTQLEAKTVFRYLPSVGILPFTTGITNRGIDLNRFFEGLTIRDPIFMEGCRLQALVRSSFSFKAIDIESKEMIWTYLVRENRQPELLGEISPSQPYLVLAEGHMPFQGQARFDASYWNLSNFGLL